MGNGKPVNRTSVSPVQVVLTHTPNSKTWTMSPNQKEVGKNNPEGRTFMISM
jgi:hypothetical protein